MYFISGKKVRILTFHHQSQSFNLQRQKRQREKKKKLPLETLSPVSTCVGWKWAVRVMQESLNLQRERETQRGRERCCQSVTKPQRLSCCCAQISPQRGAAGNVCHHSTWVGRKISVLQRTVHIWRDKSTCIYYWWV